MQLYFSAFMIHKKCVYKLLQKVLNDFMFVFFLNSKIYDINSFKIN